LEVGFKCLEVGFKCLEVSFKCLEVSFKCLEVGFKCLEVSFNCLGVAFNCLDVGFNCLGVAFDRCEIAIGCRVVEFTYVSVEFDLPGKTFATHRRGVRRAQRRPPVPLGRRCCRNEVRRLYPLITKRVILDVPVL